MKKATLKVFGVAALAAGMLYNVQVSEEEGNSGISLAALGNMAIAQSENGGGTTCCPYTGAICSTANKDFADYYNRGNGMCN